MAEFSGGPRDHAELSKRIIPPPSRSGRRITDLEGKGHRTGDGSIHRLMDGIRSGIFLFLLRIKVVGGLVVYIARSLEGILDIEYTWAVVSVDEEDSTLSVRPAGIPDGFIR